MIYKCFREWVEKNAQIPDINLAENTQLETAVFEFFLHITSYSKGQKILLKTQPLFLHCY